MPKPSTTTASAEIIKVPTGAAKQDTALITKAAKDIATIVRNTLTRGVHEVGEYLLKHFYDDDPELYHSTSPTKHASLSALVEQCGEVDLPVSKTFLSNAIRLAVMVRELPDAKSLKLLPPSHQVELLRLERAPEKLETIAERAVEKKLPVQKLRAEVRKAVAGIEKDPRGRRPTPPALRAVNKVTKLLGKEGTQNLAFLKADIAEMTDEQLEDLRGAIERANGLLDKLAKLVGE
jgi:hypothetical protein